MPQTPQAPQTPPPPSDHPLTVQEVMQDEKFPDLTYTQQQIAVGQVDPKFRALQGPAKELAWKAMLQLYPPQRSFNQVMGVEVSKGVAKGLIEWPANIYSVAQQAMYGLAGYAPEKDPFLQAVKKQTAPSNPEQETGKKIFDFFSYMAPMPGGAAMEAETARYLAQIEKQGTTWAGVGRYALSHAVHQGMDFAIKTAGVTGDPQEALIGGVTGFAMGGVFAGLRNPASQSMFKVSRNLVAQVLSPSGDYAKGLVQDELLNPNRPGGDLVRQLPMVWTREQLARIAKRNSLEALAGIKQSFQRLPPSVQIPMQRVYDAMFQMLGEHGIFDSNGEILDDDLFQSTLNMMERITDKLGEAHESAPPIDVLKFRRMLERAIFKRDASGVRTPVGEGGGWEDELDKLAAATYRKQLNEMPGDTGKFNAAYHFWEATREIIRATQRREVGQQSFFAQHEYTVGRALGSAAIGGATGYAGGRREGGKYGALIGAAGGALVGLTFGPLIMETTGFKMLTAKTLDKFAQMLAVPGSAHAAEAYLAREAAGLAKDPAERARLQDMAREAMTQHYEQQAWEDQQAQDKKDAITAQREAARLGREQKAQQVAADKLKRQAEAAQKAKTADAARLAQAAAAAQRKADTLQKAVDKANSSRAAKVTKWNTAATAHRNRVLAGKWVLNAPGQAVDPSALKPGVSLTEQPDALYSGKPTTPFVVKKNAEVLRASLEPEEVPELVDQVNQFDDMQGRKRFDPRIDGSWRQAVQRYAEAHNFDAIRFGPQESVILKPEILHPGTKLPPPPPPAGPHIAAANVAGGTDAALDAAYPGLEGEPSIQAVRSILNRPSANLPYSSTDAVYVGAAASDPALRKGYGPGEGHIFTNRAGQRFLDIMFSTLTGKKFSSAAMAVPYGAVEQIEGALGQQVATPSSVGGPPVGVTNLLSAIRTALSENLADRSPILFVNIDPPLPLRDPLHAVSTPRYPAGREAALEYFKRTIRHESIHREQFRLRGWTAPGTPQQRFYNLSPPRVDQFVGDPTKYLDRNGHLLPGQVGQPVAPAAVQKGLGSGPLFPGPRRGVMDTTKRVVSGLVTKYRYDPADAVGMAMEVPAWLGAGDAERFGITHDEAIKVLRHYFDLLIAEHGFANAREVLEVMKPGIRKELRTAYSPGIGSSVMGPPRPKPSVSSPPTPPPSSPRGTLPKPTTAGPTRTVGKRRTPPKKPKPQPLYTPPQAE